MVNMKRLLGLVLVLVCFLAPMALVGTVKANAAYPSLAGCKIAWDATHDPPDGRQSHVYRYDDVLIPDLTARGATFTIITTGPLTLSLLQQYDVWWIEEYWYGTFSDDELSALVDYVNAGGAVLFNGDEIGFSESPVGRIMNPFGISYTGEAGDPGLATDITPHPITEGVSSVNFPGPENSLSVSGPAMGVVRDAHSRILVAVATVGNGRVVAVCNEALGDDSINQGDTRRLGNNIFTWLCKAAAAPPVGGTVIPVDKLSLLAPWIVMAVLPAVALWASRKQVKPVSR